MDREHRIYTGVIGSISVGSGGGPVSAAPGSTGGAITGVKGSIRWHYYTAAAIEGYALTRSTDGRWNLTAKVVLSDAFKMAQTPLTFVAMHTKKGLDGTCVVKTEWRWPILSCELVDHQLSARLGPLEETAHE